MKVAIYARKSTEQTGAGEEQKSVARQIQHSREYAAGKGWTVLDECVFSDDGISGAEFQKRPGFLRLMNSLKPRPPFQVLVMSEESRLGREAIETGYVLKQILDAGVRVFHYLEDRERTLDSAMDKVMLSLVNFASEMERERAKIRTHDALLDRAKRGYVTGGTVYGYSNREILTTETAADGSRERSHVLREIHSEQADTVRRIFGLYVDGLGFKRIAKRLNDDGIQPPGKRSTTWAPSAIREILLRPLYRGEIVWNKTQRIDRAGTKAQRTRPESEWVRFTRAELRILPDVLWERAQEVLEQARKTHYGKETSPGGRAFRASRHHHGSPYLLTGFAKCTECGSSIISVSRSHGKQRAHFYGCSYYHTRGTPACTNAVQMRQEIVNPAIIEAISAPLSPEIIEVSIQRAIEKIRDSQSGQNVDAKALEKRIAESEARERNLIEAVKQGEAPQALLRPSETKRPQGEAYKPNWTGWQAFASPHPLT